MSKKNIFIIKSIIVSLAISFLVFLYFGLRWEFAKSENIRNIYEIRMIVSFTISFIIGIVYLLAGSFLKLKKIKPIRRTLKYSTYKSFSTYLLDRVRKYNYEMCYDEIILKLYRKQVKRKIYYVIETKLEELTEFNFDKLYNEKIFPLIQDDFNIMKYHWHQLYITMIISVDRITPMFYKFVDSGDIDKRFYKYPVGVSFGSNQIYLTGDESFGFNTDKKMVKEIKEILEIEEVKKVSE